MRHRFAELLQPVDPHLRRRKGVAPGDEADALGRVVGLLAQGGDGVRRGQDGFEHHLDRDGRRGIERPRDFLRVGGHLFQGFRAVEMLAAGDEPDFELFEIGHFHNCNNGFDAMFRRRHGWQPLIT